MYEWIGYFFSIDFINALHKRSFTGSWHFCNNVTFSVTRMWRCVGSRTAGNLYLPEGSKGKRRAGLSYLSLSSCLIGWFGISAVSRRGWEKAIKSRSFPFRARYQQRWMHAFCELTLQFSISQLGPHTPVADSTGEFFWGIMAGSQFKPDLSASHPQVHVATQDWLPLSFSTGLHLIAKGDSWKASDPWHSVIYIMS